MRGIASTASTALLAAVLLAGSFDEPCRAAEPARDLTLVEGGQPRSAVLASSKISVSERFAVKELQNLIERISGAKLPVCEPGQTPPGGEPAAWIVVGKTTAEERHKDLGLNALGNEGFVIKNIGRDLVLAGGEAVQTYRLRGLDPAAAYEITNFDVTELSQIS